MATAPESRHERWLRSSAGRAAIAESDRNERIALAVLRLLVERGIMARLVNREDAS